MKGLIIGIVCTAVHFAARGNPVVYTLSATGTGDLGETQFLNTLFVITAVADTTNITETLTPYGPTPIFLVPDITATVSVSGIGSGAFTTLTYSVANSQGPASGISESNLLDILDITSPALSNYDLSFSVGPMAGTPTINSRVPFETTAGYFTLFSVSSVTFQASVVPEPSTYTLLGVGLVGTILLRRIHKAILPKQL